MFLFCWLILAARQHAEAFGVGDALVAGANFVEYLYYEFGVNVVYPNTEKPKLPEIKWEPVPASNEFGYTLEQHVLNATPYLLTVIGANDDPWKVYKVSDLIGRKDFFQCENVVYTDWHQRFWGLNPHRKFLHWQAEWQKSMPQECFFLMSEDSENPPDDGLQYFGRYPAGIQLMHLIKTGVISTGGNTDPWLLYVDTDIVLTRRGAGVSSIVQTLRQAGTSDQGTLENVYLGQTAATSSDTFNGIGLVIATDPGCSFKRESKWPRMNSGTLLFRPVPFVAYVFEAVVASWVAKRSHHYDRLDQAMLTLVLTDSFDFPHKTLREVCRSGHTPAFSLRNGPDDQLWAPACRGEQLVWIRDFNDTRTEATPETYKIAQKWMPRNGQQGPTNTAMCCSRLTAGSLLRTPVSLTSAVWTWQCGDIGMHMIGVYTWAEKFTFLSSRWREEHLGDCRHILPMETMPDGKPFWTPDRTLRSEDTRIHSRLSGLSSPWMKPINAREIPFGEP